MLQLTSKITIGTFFFDYVTDIEITSSWQDLTDKAKIVIPRRLRWDGKPITNSDTPLIKRGDKVTIDLGYDYNFQRVFEGYVSKVHPKTPLEIECEDAMWLLKQASINKSYPNINYQALLKDILNEASKKNPAIAEANLKINGNFERTLGKLRFPNKSVAEIFDHLKKEHTIYTFIRNGIIYASQISPYQDATTQDFEFERNIVSDSLEYVRAKDVKIKVIVKVLAPDPNSKHGEPKVQEFATGDPDGEIRTILLYDIPAKDAIELANTEIRRLKYDGFRGNFLAFGLPYVRHGDIANLVDKKIPDRNGKYLISQVKTNFGVSSGYRQEVTLYGLALSKK